MNPEKLTSCRAFTWDTLLEGSGLECAADGNQHPMRPRRAPSPLNASLKFRNDTLPNFIDCQ
jgi:hypothetical protein